MRENLSSVLSAVKIKVPPQTHRLNRKSYLLIKILKFSGDSFYMRKKQQTTEDEDSHDHITLLRAEKNIIKA